MEQKFNDLQRVKLMTHTAEATATEILAFEINDNIVTVVWKMKD
jgi:hypothetical protein